MQKVKAMNEQELVSRVKEGNEEAFTTLYYIYSSKVFNFTRLYVQSTTESEEIVQEVFCKLWESRELLNQGEDLNGCSSFG
jgi:RNA polymerase sigma-70 factor (ECF subfamily)